MEIQSFILGMGAVLVVAAVIVGVVAFFKVIKLNEEILSMQNQIDSQFENANKNLEDSVAILNNRFNDVYSDIDSRYDKLKSVFSKEIEYALKQKNN